MGHLPRADTETYNGRYIHRIYAFLYILTLALTSGFAFSVECRVAIQYHNGTRVTQFEAIRFSTLIRLSTLIRPWTLIRFFGVSYIQ